MKTVRETINYAMATGRLELDEESRRLGQPRQRSSTNTIQPQPADPALAAEDGTLNTWRTQPPRRSANNVGAILGLAGSALTSAVKTVMDSMSLADIEELKAATKTTNASLEQAHKNLTNASPLLAPLILLGSGAATISS